MWGSASHLFLSLSPHQTPFTVLSITYFPFLETMNNDSLAIAIDRLKFYARDAVLTLTQVSCFFILLYLLKLNI